MHFSKNTALVALATAAGAAAQTNGTTGPVTGLLGNATIQNTNPVGVAYQAVLPANKMIQGSISAVALTAGGPLTYKVSFSNFPAVGSPFIYHIHEKAIPADGNCTAALAHLDPFKRGEVPICNASLPETCQTGDLSGKYGNITADPWVVTFTDPFTSTDPNSASFIGNLSIVVHTFNKTRLTCANFTRVAANNTTSTTTLPTTLPTGTATSTRTATATGSGPALATTNAAAELGSKMLGWSGVVGLAAAVLAL